MTLQASNLRVGLVGVGRMGLRHLQVLDDLGMDIVGLADRSDEAVAQARGRQAGAAGAQTYADGVEMIAATRPDAVVIATTAPSHAMLVEAAVANGARFVLCEKPIGTSIAESERIVEACRAAGAKLAVNHQMRFMAQYTEVKRLIGSEAFGPLASVVVAGSNFGLAMNGSHYFEMFRYIADAPVTDVSAWLDEELLPNPRGPEFEDRSGRLLARNAIGQTLFMDMPATAGWGLNVTYLCRNGQIHVDELNGEMRLAYREAEYRDLPTTRYGMPVEREVVSITPADAVAPTREVWQAMLAGDDYPTGEDGLAALRCLVAAHLSHESGGQAVAIADTGRARERRFGWA